MKSLILITLVIFFSLNHSITAQHQHKPVTSDSTMTKKHAANEHDMNMHDMNMHDMNMHDMNMNDMNMNDMSSTTMLNIPMSMEGSGTSWLPESSPMHMAMYHSGDWMLMMHGNITAGYINYGSKKKVNRFSAPNWIMGMTSHRIGMSNQIGFRLMISLDRLTEGGIGYPLLFQTGESWKGIPLIDRQHPHDLFGELSVSLSHAFSKELGTFLYFGLPGEPSLGPPVYLHRVSSSGNPDAPLGHHWQDATHITFGVATIGLYLNRIKIEASYFNGSEPDENRFNFDKPKFNSYSGRISFAPGSNLSIQASSAYIKNPEGDGANVTRTTASIMHNIMLMEKKYFASIILWGLNNENTLQHSLLLESLYNFSDNAIYGRIEFVQKPHKEFDIETDPDKTENIFAYTAGYRRTIAEIAGINFNAGLQGTLYSQTDFLKQYYGDFPYTFQLYIEINPAMYIH